MKKILLLSFVLLIWLLPAAGQSDCPDKGPITTDDVYLDADGIFEETYHWALLAEYAMDQLREVLCAEERREEAHKLPTNERRAADERRQVNIYMDKLIAVFFAQEPTLANFKNLDFGVLLGDYDEVIMPRPEVAFLRYKNAGEYARVCHANLRRCLNELELHLQFVPDAP